MDTTGQARLLQELSGQATISVEEAGRLLGIGRSAAYEAVRQGQIPSLPIGQRRIRVPMARLLRLLGYDSPDTPNWPPAEPGE